MPLPAAAGKQVNNKMVFTAAAQPPRCTWSQSPVLCVTFQVRARGCGEWTVKALGCTMNCMPICARCSKCTTCRGQGAKGPSSTGSHRR